MAARTTTADGAISNVTGTNLDGSTALGTTDTLTGSHNNNFDANTTFGSSPSTDGTAAFAFGAADKTLTIDDGIDVIIKGDLFFDGPSFGDATYLQLDAGSSLTFLPPSGQQYKFKNTDSSGLIYISGSSGSRCAVRTDKSSGGLGTHTELPNFVGSGFQTVDYCDFEDMGTTTQWGVGTRSGSPVSITNCTFTDSNYRNRGTNEHDFTFQGNVFATSVTIDVAGFPCCAEFDLLFGASASDWLIDTNGFDAYVSLQIYNAGTVFSNNVLPRAYIAGSSSWDSASDFTGNIIWDCVDQSLWGSTTGCYFFSLFTTSNVHYINPSAANVSVTNSVFEADTHDGGGDIASYPVTSGTCTLTGNISLGKSNAAAGKLLACTAVTSGSFTVNHNTIVGTSEQGLIGMSETESSYAGQLTACRSNLIYGSTTGNYIAAIRDVGAGTPAVDAVTLATHNYFRNASLGTCVYNTSTSQGSVAGYDGVKISLNDDYPNAQVGANDGTISADPFVDVTRTFAKWAAFKGQSETSAAGVAYAIANPAAATHATTGLLAWVRAGHKVTGAAGSTLQNAGHDGVTVGALAFQAAEDAPTPVLIQSTDILVI